MAYNWNNYNKPKKKSNRNKRPDHLPGHRTEYERNRKIILATQDICALCGEPVDKRIKYPDPYAATIDHIIPVSKGGHPSDLENLQLAHFKCNRDKADKLQFKAPVTQQQCKIKEYEPTDPRGLPWLIDWKKYRGTEDEDRESNFNELFKEAEALRAAGYIITGRGILTRK